MIGSDMVRGKPLVIFDGYCNLCNFWTKFLFAADSKHKLVFAARQSVAAQQLLTRHGNNSTRVDAVLLIEGSVIHSRSTAILRALKLLGGFWRLTYIFVLIPPPLRNLIYELVARNRYRLFGKSSECRTPSRQEREYFLE